MQSGGHCDVAVVAAYEWISQLLEDCLVPEGWNVIVVSPAELRQGASRMASCRVVLCSLDLSGKQRATVRAAGIPVIYFSASRSRSELDVPADAAGFFDLPPDREALGRLIRSIL